MGHEALGFLAGKLLLSSNQGILFCSSLPIVMVPHGAGVGCCRQEAGSTIKCNMGHDSACITDRPTAAALQ